jgi:uncharacterized protein YfkK (UPF0435 family)
MKVSKFNRFINEQKATIEQQMAIVNQGLLELDQYDEMNPDPEDIADMIEDLKGTNHFPQVVKDQLIRTMTLMANGEFRVAQRENLTYLKGQLEEGKDLEYIMANDEDHKVLARRVEELTTKILNMDLSEFTKGVSKFIKGASKLGDIRREEAEKVVATPEDPYGEESWEGAMSEEDAMRLAFEDDEEEIK